jgi:hypothetical protein
MSNKDASELSYDELKALLDTKKQELLATLSAEIVELESNLANKRVQLEELTGAPAEVKRRGRPAGLGKKTKIKGPIGKKSTKGGKRWSAKDLIIAFLKSKGKDGAHLSEIVQASGKKKNQISAFLATTGKKLGIVGTGKKGFYYLKA